jgi:hypothetical protein
MSSDEKHGEGCGCYWCLPPRPGISAPPTWAEVVRMEREVEAEYRVRTT